MLKWKKQSLKILSVLSILLVGYVVFSKWEDRRILKSLLNLRELPKSIEAMSCKSCATTDVISVCSFKLSSEDAEKIISAYPFKEDPSLIPYSHTGCGGVEPYFKPSIALEFQSPEFKQGGRIRLFLNKHKTQGLIDYYVE